MVSDVWKAGGLGIQVNQMVRKEQNPVALKMAAFADGKG
jgi:hypothetical protein